MRGAGLESLSGGDHQRAKRSHLMLLSLLIGHIPPRIRCSPEKGECVPSSVT